MSSSGNSGKYQANDNGDCRNWELEKTLPRQTAYNGDRYYWVVTKTCVVRAISKDVLARAGLISCLDYYNERHALKLCWTAVCRTARTGGVKEERKSPLLDCPQAEGSAHSAAFPLSWRIDLRLYHGGIKFSIAPRSFGWWMTKWMAGALFLETIAHFPSWIWICKLRKT